jgi:hypothetical protein
VNSGKVCEGLSHLRKEGSKILVEWKSGLKRPDLQLALGEQVKLPQ